MINCFDDYERQLQEGMFADTDFEVLILSTESETNNNVNSFDKHYYFYNYYKNNRIFIK